MSFNIVDAIHEHVTPDELQNVATMIGEPADKTRTAMSTGVLGIVGSLIQRGSSPSGAAGILETLTLPNVGGVATLWKSFFGGNAEKVYAVVAKTSGINPAASQRVMAALLPIAATVLGRKVTEHGLGADGLANLLLSQKDKLASIPGAGAVMAALGMPAANATAGESLHTVTPQITSTEKTANHERSKRRWLPVAAALGGLALAGLLVGHFMSKSPAPVADQGQTSQTTVTGAELPNGVVVVERLFEAKDGSKVTLSDVTFDFSTANLHQGKDTLEKVAGLMKEHPTATLRIEGHTDTVGDDNANQILSAKRADAVKKILVDQGVDEKRIEAVGMGERGPVAPNDTEAGREKNRRIDAVIVKH